MKIQKKLAFLGAILSLSSVHGMDSKTKETSSEKTEPTIDMVVLMEAVECNCLQVLNYMLSPKYSRAHDGNPSKFNTFDLYKSTHEIQELLFVLGFMDTLPKYKYIEGYEINIRGREERLKCDLLLNYVKSGSNDLAQNNTYSRERAQVALNEKCTPVLEMSLQVDELLSPNLSISTLILRHYSYCLWAYELFGSDEAKDYQESANKRGRLFNRRVRNKPELEAIVQRYRERVDSYDHTKKYD